MSFKEINTLAKKRKAAKGDRHTKSLFTIFTIFTFTIFTFIFIASIKFNLGKCASFISMYFKNKCDLTLEKNVYSQNTVRKKEDKMYNSDLTDVKLALVFFSDTVILYSVFLLLSGLKHFCFQFPY